MNHDNLITEEELEELKKCNRMMNHEQFGDLHAESIEELKRLTAEEIMHNTKHDAEPSSI